MRPNVKKPMTFVKGETPLVAGLIFLILGSLLLGSLSIVGFLVVGILFVFTRFPYVLAGCRINWPLLMFPLLGLVSTLWADYPALTLRHSLQLLVTIILFIGVIYTITL